VSRVLCVANWSEGRDIETLTLMRRAMRAFGAEAHFEGADVDHNRLVTAFSGGLNAVRDTVFAIAEVAFDRIDMRSHRGVHPRIGALDVCPFIILGDSMSPEEASAYAVSVASHLAERFDLPVFLYEKSETGRHARDLPALRKGQYEGLFGRTLDPDFGPTQPNSQLGATVVGVRDWLLAVNVNLSGDVEVAKGIAKEIRLERDRAIDQFEGVRALGLELTSRGLSQVSMNLTRPDETAVDPIVGWIKGQASIRGARVEGTELIGVIRPSDLPSATSITVRPEQVVEP
jgi:glutamate formiminotransferase